jgi:uncharacterized protein GlcG (DUF336 family)
MPELATAKWRGATDSWGTANNQFVQSSDEALARSTPLARRVGQFSHLARKLFFPYTGKRQQQPQSNPGGAMSQLTLAQANTIIGAALAVSSERGYRAMAVVVLDESGHIRAVQREDGASMFRIDIATGKAWAAVSMGASSRALGERAQGNPNFFVSLAATAHGKFLPQTGAVLIIDPHQQVIGAVGASGGTGDEDEAICIAGIRASGLQYA